MSDSRALAIAWYYREHFGFSKAPPQSDPEVVRNMAQALFAAAAADGDLSASERSWIVGYMAAKGYPSEVIDELSRASEVSLTKVPGLMELGILKKSGRILVYDAIRAASADGYSADERKAVARVAEALGISASELAAIEKLVEEEQVLKQKRIAVLMPGGHPNL